MRAFWRHLLVILWKDTLLDLRTRELVAPMLVFALLVIVIFNFVFDLRPAIVLIVAPGVLWVAFTFAGTLGLSRTFALEKDHGCIDGLMLCPISRDILYLGKLSGSFLFILVVQMVMLPIFSLLYNLPFFLPELWLILALATLGFGAVGTSFSAMAVNTRAREIMLPLLFFPIVVPVIIAAVEATGGVLRGDPWGDYSRWIGLTVAFDAIFLVVAAVTFEFVLGE